MGSLPSATSHLEAEAIALINSLTALWGQLDAAETRHVESDPLRRSTLSRIKHVQETNGVFMAIRQLFHIPENVRVSDFPQWLEQAMQIQKDRMFAEWQERLARKRIEAPMEQDFEPDNFLVHGGE
jgi:hypothetical protein